MLFGSVLKEIQAPRGIPTLDGEHSHKAGNIHMGWGTFTWGREHSHRAGIPKSLVGNNYTCSGLCVCQWCLQYLCISLGILCRFLCLFGLLSRLGSFARALARSQCSSGPYLLPSSRALTHAGTVRSQTVDAFVWGCCRVVTCSMGIASTVLAFRTFACSRVLPVAQR